MGAGAGVGGGAPGTSLISGCRNAWRVLLPNVCPRRLLRGRAPHCLIEPPEETVAQLVGSKREQSMITPDKSRCHRMTVSLDRCVPGA